MSLPLLCQVAAGEAIVPVLALVPIPPVIGEAKTCKRLLQTGDIVGGIGHVTSHPRIIGRRAGLLGIVDVVSEVTQPDQIVQGLPQDPGKRDLSGEVQDQNRLTRGHSEVPPADLCDTRPAVLDCQAASARSAGRLWSGSACAAVGRIGGCSLSRPWATRSRPRHSKLTAMVGAIPAMSAVIRARPGGRSHDS